MTQVYLGVLAIATAALVAWLLERWAAPGAVLLLHDTMPLNTRTAASERSTGFYTGDGQIVPDLCFDTVSFWSVAEL